MDQGLSHALAEIERGLGENRPAAELFETLDALQLDDADPTERVKELILRGLLLNRLAMPREAEAALAKALRHADPQDEALVGKVLRTRAVVHSWRGEPHAARRCLVDAFTCAAAAEDPVASALCAFIAGRLELEEGAAEAAHQTLRRGLTLMPYGQEVRQTQKAHVNLAQACNLEGDTEAALSTLEALANYELLPRDHHLMRLERVRALIGQKDLKAATDEYQRAEAELPEDPDSFEATEWRHAGAELTLAADGPEAGLAAIAPVLARYQADELGGRLVQAHFFEADCHRALGDEAAETDAVTRALRLARRHGLDGFAEAAVARFFASGRFDRAGGAEAHDPHAARRYLRRGRLGAGAFGTVERALDLEDGSEVALKRIRIGELYEPKMRDRLLDSARREAAAATAILHPGVARLREFYIDGRGDACIVSDFIEGQTLRDALADGPISSAHGMLAKLCHAVSAIHGGGIVHRDLKPENVILKANGDPIVIDFGVSRPPSLGDKDLAAVSGPYTSPEQAANKTTGPQTDIYALAKIIRETLTGSTEGRMGGGGFRLGFGGARRGLGGLLDEAVQRDPSKRRVTAADLAAALSREAEG